MLTFYKMQQGDAWLLSAGIHGGGLPNVPEVKINQNKAWCHHRKESFPIWHRPYLWEFEKQMQKFDPRPDPNNPLMLPYWDWSTPGINHTPPSWVYQERVTLKIDGVDKTVINPLFSGPSKDHARTGDGSRTRRATTLDTSGVQSASDDIFETLQEDNYPEFSHLNNPVSLETPHGTIHVAVGGNGDMGDVSRAAFDPIFWFHHCNVERLLYSWQKMNPRLLPKDTNASLAPFPPRNQHGVNGLQSWSNNTNKYSVSSEWFDINTLDYTFDKLASAPDRGNQMRARKRYVVFWDVPHPMQSILIKVHIREKGSPKLKYSLVDERKDPSFAGVITIFAFNRHTTDGFCDECNVQAPTAYSLDVTDFLDNMNLKNKTETLDTVDIEVRIQNAGGEDVDLNKIFKGQKFPAADLLWENEFLADAIDTSKLQNSNSRDVKLLRQFLEYYGYTSGGSLKDLNAGLRKFQESWGLKADGILGEVTQKQIFKARSANSDVNDDTEPILLNKLKNKQTKFKYTVTDVDEDLVDVTKPDLGLSDLLHVLDACFAAWANPLSEKLGEKVSFEYVEPTADGIDIEISWQLFDGVGGTLGYASSKEGLVGCSIQLDRAERWTLNNKEEYSLQPVVTHEIGHLFGLHHENKESTIMFPYYRPDVLAPRDVDVDAVVAKFKAHH